jgi:FlaA1/EpsC-like NDP-sugar epimerase
LEHTEGKMNNTSSTMKTFENKIVLITGGTSGIGKATALAF